jgi:DnaJ-domain-containing protein 1
MKKYYQILGLDEGATLQEVEKKYNELLKEFDPQKQSDDDLKEFFKSEQDKVKEAYLKISLSFTNINEEVVITKEIDEIEKEIDNLDVDDSNDILIYYKTLKLSEDATLAEINTKYNLLLDEFNPDHQSDDLRDFFEKEQEKVEEAYNTIVKHLSEEESEEQVEKFLNEAAVDSEVNDLGDYLENDELVEKKIKYSWWAYDDEYISGWQYFGRTLVGGMLSLILIGLYLNSVTAYKRAKSLQSTSTTFFSIWGGVSIIIGISPIAILNIPFHWYLWFSNGKS